MGRAKSQHESREVAISVERSRIMDRAKWRNDSCGTLVATWVTHNKNFRAVSAKDFLSDFFCLNKCNTDANCTKKIQYK